MANRTLNAGRKAAYSAPSLIVYGGLARMTAAGSGATTETMVTPNGTAAMG